MARRDRPQHVTERIARLEQPVALSRVRPAARAAEPALGVVEAEHHLGPWFESFVCRAAVSRAVNAAPNRSSAGATPDQSPSVGHVSHRVPDGGRAPAGGCRARTGRHRALEAADDRGGAGPSTPPTAAAVPEEVEAGEQTGPDRARRGAAATARRRSRPSSPGRAVDSAGEKAWRLRRRKRPPPHDSTWIGWPRTSTGAEPDAACDTAR